jgi:AcrR family transcriptional regulator
VPRPKLRTPELRDQVLRAALDVLASGGIEQLTARRVARAAGTSVPAVYELFGDKAGLVRALFFEGFDRLGAALDTRSVFDLPDPSGRSKTERGDSDPAAELVTAVRAIRRFVLDQPALASVMFRRPVADFDPGPDELAAAARLREHLVTLLRRCVDEGRADGDPVDLAHVQLAIVQGLAAQEAAGWLGTSAASIERRWDLGATALLRTAH